MCCRLGEDQREYVDRKGIHVVVGHYLGEAAASPSLNLTDGAMARTTWHYTRIVIRENGRLETHFGVSLPFLQSW